MTKTDRRHEEMRAVYGAYMAARARGWITEAEQTEVDALERVFLRCVKRYRQAVVREGTRLVAGARER